MIAAFTLSGDLITDGIDEEDLIAELRGLGFTDEEIDTEVQISRVIP